MPAQRTEVVARVIQAIGSPDSHSHVVPNPSNTTPSRYKAPRKAARSSERLPGFVRSAATTDNETSQEGSNYWVKLLHGMPPYLLIEVCCRAYEP